MTYIFVFLDVGFSHFDPFFLILFHNVDFFCLLFFLMFLICSSFSGREGFFFCWTTPLQDRPSAGHFAIFPSPVANFVLSSLFGSLFRGIVTAVQDHRPPKVRGHFVKPGGTTTHGREEEAAPAKKEGKKTAPHKRRRI